jgi:TfoX/Sxy family transcriptional regulator of competence genes
MSLSEFLKSLLDEASQDLPMVTARRMFGCDALFANLAIYALVWKTGRLGLKLSDPALYREAMALAGAEPWAPGGKPMAHWVLLPESLHDEPEELSTWVRHAHRLASATGAPKKKKPAAPKRGAAAP